MSAKGFPAILAIAVLCACSESSTDYSGKFGDDQLRLDLRRDPDGRYSGTLQRDGKSYTIRAQVTGNALNGEYGSNGTTFGFTATMESNGLHFSTGTASRVLKKLQ